MGMDGPSGASGNTGASRAADASQATNDSVESKLSQLQTAEQQAQVAADSTLSAAHITQNAINAKDTQGAISASRTVNARNAETQAAATETASLAAEINNDPRATAAQKAAALEAARITGIQAQTTATIKESIDREMERAGMRADASPSLDPRYAVSSSALHQLNDITVSGTTGTYADVAAGRKDV